MIRNVVVLALILAGIVASPAAQLKEARVTEIVKDVKLLPTGSAPRPAAVSDEVRDGTAVRTGVESRSELKFPDQTLARLGANTVFSFNEGTRSLNLQDGAMLLRVPKGAGGAKISSSAVTAAITGTTVMVEAHPVTQKRKNSYYKFIVLEGTARLFLPGQLGESVLVKAGQMIIMPLGGTKKIPEAVDVDIQTIMQTSLLITGFGPLGSEQLIAFEQTRQSQQITSGQLVETNLMIAGGGTNVILVDPSTVDVAVTAQKSEGSGPFASPTSTPTVTPTPGKFGTPVPITSPDPYVITSGTTITTDPSITTNSVTASGKIYQGAAIDGPASAWAFGSTSNFDTSSGFDEQIVGSGAAFKFTALRLAGNPTISTANGGEMNLGLIAVNGITSGSPGGPLTFSGIRGLLLATQNGPIALGSEISFSGLHDITLYARGAGSVLTLASDISTTSDIRLYGENAVLATGNLSTQRLTAAAGTIISIGGAGSTTINASEASLLIPNSGSGNIPSAAIALLSVGNLALNDSNGLSLTIDNTNGGHIGQGAIISLTAANLNAGSLNVFINNRNGGSIGSSAQVFCSALGALGTLGALNVQGNAAIGISNRNDEGGGGTTGTDAMVNVLADSISVGGELDGFVSANGGGHIGNTALLQLTTTGDIHSGTGTALLVQSTGFNVPGGPFIAPGFIGLDALLDVNAADLISNGFIDAEVGEASGHIGRNAGLNLNISGAITAPDIFVLVGGPAGQIGGDASLQVTAGSISASNTAVFQIENDTGGKITGNASLDVTTTNLSGNSLFVAILNSVNPNTRNGTIGKNATINFNVSGTATVATDATFQINGSDSAASSTINFNGGTYNVGGTFEGFMDGSGTMTFKNAAITARDAIKVEVFGSNGTLRIGGGLLLANTLLHLYAPGSNGMIDFVADTTLNSSGTAVVMAANTVTVENGVKVTIGGSTPANVFANVANYSGQNGSGGNNSTTGTFAGAGATTQPLGGQPPFDGSSARLAAKQTKSARLGGGIGHTIHVTDSSQLGALLENASPGRDGKVHIASAAISRTASTGNAPARTSRVASARDRQRSPDMNVSSKMVVSRLP
jgi:mannose-6-phosphate isomerase-like protein (cupin superfamily)